jgi:hypothetical protein
MRIVKEKVCRVRCEEGKQECWRGCGSRCRVRSTDGEKGGRVERSTGSRARAFVKEARNAQYGTVEELGNDGAASDDRRDSKKT